MAIFYGSTADAKAELRSLLAEYGLEDLTDIAYELQLRGITDPEQLLLELEDTSVFRNRFPGYRDENGQRLATIPEIVSFERTVAQRLGDLGFSAADLGVPLNVFVAQQIVNHRSMGEVNEDLNTLALLKSNPRLAQDFYSWTGIDPGPAGLFAIITGQAPDLKAAYEKAKAGGVNVDTFLRRRFEFENHLNATKTRKTEIDARQAAISAARKPLDERLEKTRKLRDDARKDYRTKRAKRKANYDEWAKLKSRAQELLAIMQSARWKEMSASQKARIRKEFESNRDRRATLVDANKRIKGDMQTLQKTIRDYESRIGKIGDKLDPFRTEGGALRTEETAVDAKIEDLDASLEALIADGVDRPDFDPGDPFLGRYDVLQGLKNAQQMEAARWRSGGGLTTTDSRPRQKSF